MPQSERDLESRIRQIEDRLTIEDLIAAYGPAADSCDGEAIAALWAEDGRYIIGGDWVLNSAQSVAGLTELDQHRDFVTKGCAHVLSPHRITVEGDTAHAEGYSMVMTHDAAHGQWILARVSANRWTFERRAEGWRTVTRQADLLDGAEQARALLNMTYAAKEPT